MAHPIRVQIRQIERSSDQTSMGLEQPTNLDFVHLMALPEPRRPIRKNGGRHRWVCSIMARSGIERRRMEGMQTHDMDLLKLAIAEAEAGLAEGGIPIGAVLAADGVVLGAGHNQRIQLGSSIHHGETAALENAGRQPASVYRRSTMYTTLSPCDMCTGAILLYGIPRVVIGENRTFMGGEDLLRSRGVEVVVADSRLCVVMMERFIADSPTLWNEDIGE